MVSINFPFTGSPRYCGGFLHGDAKETPTAVSLGERCGGRLWGEQGEVDLSGFRSRGTATATITERPRCRNRTSAADTTLTLRAVTNTQVVAGQWMPLCASGNQDGSAPDVFGERDSLKVGGVYASTHTA